MTYNLVNTFDWFKGHAKPIEGHDPSDWKAAMDIANDGSKVPTGLLFQAQRPTLHDLSHPLKADAGALDPIAAAADPSQALAASRKRFDGWLDEFKVR